MQWGVCIEILVETILRLESTVQGLSSVVRTTISSTQPLFTVSGLLHRVRVVQQVVIRVKMVVVAMGLLLLRMVFALATRSGGGRWTTGNHRNRIIVIIARGTQRGQQFRWRGARLDHQLLGRLKLEKS